MYSLQDIGNFILYFFGIIAVVGGIVAVIFLISTLNNVNKLLKRVDGVIEKNEDKITQTVDNVNDITRTVKHGVTRWNNYPDYRGICLWCYYNFYWKNRWFLWLCYYFKTCNKDNF